MSSTDICCHFRMVLSWDYGTIWRSGFDLSLHRPIQKGMGGIYQMEREKEGFYILEKSGEH